MSKIANELKKRRESREDDNAVIGVEIKNRRLSLSKTLMSLSSKICSVSYTSKLENNKIIGNNIYVRELCERVELSEEKIDILMRLKSVVEEMIKSYYLGDIKSIERAFEMGKGLTNFRYQIMEFIYYVSIRDVCKSAKIYDRLIKLMSTITDFDLCVLSIFSSILLYLEGSFSEALELLSAIGTLNFYEADMLVIKYTYYCMIALNYREAMTFYKDLLNLINKNGAFFMLEEINYCHAIYAVKNNMITKRNYLKLITDPKNKNSALLLNSLLNNEQLDSSDLEVNELGEVLLALKTDKKVAKDIIDKQAELGYRHDFNIEFLNYQLLEADEDKMKYLVDVAIPAVLRRNESALCKYFIDELARISLECMKYKYFAQSYMKLLCRKDS